MEWILIPINLKLILNFKPDASFDWLGAVVVSFEGQVSLATYCNTVCFFTSKPQPPTTCELGSRIVKSHVYCFMEVSMCANGFPERAIPKYSCYPLSLWSESYFTMTDKKFIEPHFLALRRNVFSSACRNHGMKRCTCDSWKSLYWPLPAYDSAGLDKYGISMFCQLLAASPAEVKHGEVKSLTETQFLR